MWFNVAQKHLSTAARFGNAFAIVALFDVSTLGIYAFSVSISNIGATFCGGGFRSSFLRDYLKSVEDKDKLASQSYVAFVEVTAKLTGTIFAFLIFAILTYFGTGHSMVGSSVVWRFLKLHFKSAAETAQLREKHGVPATD